MEIDLFKLIKVLMPPPASDEKAQQVWRWTVFSFMLSMLLAFTTHVAIACGYFRPWASGFVLSNDPRLDRINFVATTLLEMQMDEAQTKVCRTKDSDYQDELGKEIAHKELAYAFITGKGYTLPRCAPQ